jgi:UDP-MurNAc hydroxylase
VTTPDHAKRRFDALAAETGATTECVVMPPGSSWSESGGFSIVAFDFSQREAYVEAMAQRHADALAAQAAKEAAATADLGLFEAYFSRFLRALPWFVRYWRLHPIVFRVRDRAGIHHWLVDPGRVAVSVVDLPPEGAVIIEVHAVVLNDCAAHNMFSVWTASKRLKIRLPAAAAVADAMGWFTLLDWYETDLLPLRANLGLRSLSVRLRRWREPVELAKLLLRRIFLRERFSVSRLYPVPGSAAPLARPG